jgi:hypothetical protein
MSNAYSPATQQVSKPYITLDTFKQAPTALDYTNLVVGGNQAAQDAELSNAILRASSWIDQYCEQVIGATVDTEQQRARINREGQLILHPKSYPIIALTSLKVGYNQQSLTAVPDCSVAWLEDQQIVFPYANANLTWSNQGALSFAAGSTSGNRVYCNYSYVNGYAITTTASALTAGATSLTLVDATGLLPGSTFTLFDGELTERVTVASSYTFGSATVPLVSGLVNSHLAGISASALPAAIQEACILATASYLKVRGDSALVMGMGNRVGSAVGFSSLQGPDMEHAKELLKPFRVIR